LQLCFSSVENFEDEFDHIGATSGKSPLKVAGKHFFFSPFWWTQTLLRRSLPSMVGVLFADVVSLPFANLLAPAIIPFIP